MNDALHEDDVTRTKQIGALSDEDAAVAEGLASKSRGREARGGSASQLVIDHITEGIRDGLYAPGQRLIEADLVRDLGISRTIVREALRWLAAGGFVDLEANRGAAVRRLSRKEIRDVLSILQTLTHQAIREIVDQIDQPNVRQGLEASLAASQAFRKRAEAAVPLAAYRDENVRFHDALYALSGNDMLKDVRDRLRIHILRLEWQGFLTASNSAEWTAGHEECLIAMLRGDYDAAIRVKREGLERIRKTILALPDNAFA